MSYGPIHRLGPVTIASAATSSSAFSLTKAYSEIALEIPTMASAGEFYIQASQDGTNYRRVVMPNVTTATVAYNTFTVASTATNRVVVLPFRGYPYMKIEITTAPATTASFYLICSD